MEGYPQAGCLGHAHIRTGSQGVPVQGGQGHLVEVNQAQLPHPRSEQHMCCMAAHTLQKQDMRITCDEI